MKKAFTFYRFNPYEFLAILWLFSLTFFLYFNAFNLWLTFDDPYLLNTAIFDHLAQIFFVPEKYQTISLLSFTPFILLSLKIDYFLSGFGSSWYYIHHLLSLSLLAVCIYLLCRRWGKIYALIGSTIFLLTGPALVGAYLLMLRHYIEGAIFACISLLLYFDFPKKTYALWVASICYLLACLNKELYIIIPFFVPFFLSGSLWPRLQKTLPLIIMLIIYILWRLYMLPAGGIGHLKSGISMFWHGWPWMGQVLVNALSCIWGAQFQGLTLILLIILHIVFIFFILFQVGFRHSNWPALLGVLVLVILSMLVIAPRWGGFQPEDYITYRLLFHLSICICIGLAYFFSQGFRFLYDLEFKGNKTVINLIGGTGIILLGVFLVSNYLHLQNKAFAQVFLASSQNYEFYYKQSFPKTLVIQTKGNHWQELALLRKHFSRGRPPAVCQAPYDFRDVSTTYYRYYKQRRIFEDISQEFAVQNSKFLQKLDPEQTMQIDIGLHQGEFSFLAKTKDSKTTYYLLLGDQSDIYWTAIKVTSPMKTRLYARDIKFYLRVMAKIENRYILSPEWTINMAKEKDIVWSGQSKRP